MATIVSLETLVLIGPRAEVVVDHLALVPGVERLRLLTGWLVEFINEHLSLLMMHVSYTLKA